MIPARQLSIGTGATEGKMVGGLPDTSMCGPHRHRHAHQVFGHSDAAHIAETVYNTLRRDDGRIRWQDIDLSNPTHASLRDEALREGERQKAETRARRRAKRQREADEDAAKLCAMKAEGKRCGNCNCGNTRIPFPMQNGVESGNIMCDLYSDFYGYVFVSPSDICKNWSPDARAALIRAQGTDTGEGRS